MSHEKNLAAKLGAKKKLGKKKDSHPHQISNGSSLNIVDCPQCPIFGPNGVKFEDFTEKKVIAFYQ